MILIFKNNDWVLPRKTYDVSHQSQTLGSRTGSSRTFGVPSRAPRPSWGTSLAIFSRTRRSTFRPVIFRIIWRNRAGYRPGMPSRPFTRLMAFIIPRRNRSRHRSWSPWRVVIPNFTSPVSVERKKKKYKRKCENNYHKSDFHTDRYKVSLLKSVFHKSQNRPQGFNFKHTSNKSLTDSFKCDKTREPLKIPNDWSMTFYLNPFQIFRKNLDTLGHTMFKALQQWTGSSASENFRAVPVYYLFLCIFTSISNNFESLCFLKLISFFGKI